MHSSSLRLSGEFRFQADDNTGNVLTQIFYNEGIFSAIFGASRRTQNTKWYGGKWFEDSDFFQNKCKTEE